VRPLLTPPRSARRSPSRPPDEVLPPESVPSSSPLRSVSGRTEELGESLEEACQHLLQQPEYRDVTFGVLEPLSLTELAPGALGWRRDIRLAPPHGIARLYLVLRPGGTKTDSPLAGVKAKDFPYRHAVEGNAGVELLLRSAATPDLPRLRDVAEAIRHELEAE
jgi:hypothetical protein